METRNSVERRGSYLGGGYVVGVWGALLCGGRLVGEKSPYWRCAFPLVLLPEKMRNGNYEGCLKQN